MQNYQNILSDLLNLLCFLAALSVMIFIQLSKFRRKLTKEDAERTNRELMPMLEGKGIKSLGAYFTLGRYDVVVVFEAPDEKAAMWLAGQVSDRASSETLVAMKREDALKLLQ